VHSIIDALGTSWYFLMMPTPALSHPEKNEKGEFLEQGIDKTSLL
jgi:hypothetical protein